MNFIKALTAAAILSTAGCQSAYAEGDLHGTSEPVVIPYVLVLGGVTMTPRGPMPAEMHIELPTKEACDVALNGYSRYVSGMQYPDAVLGGQCLPKPDYDTAMEAFEARNSAPTSSEPEPFDYRTAPGVQRDA